MSKKIKIKTFRVENNIFEKQCKIQKASVKKKM